MTGVLREFPICIFLLSELMLSKERLRLRFSQALQLALLQLHSE